MKPIFLLVIGLLALVVNLTAKIKREDEAFLPFQAELTQNFLPEDGSEELEKGTRFIILRPLDNDQLLVTFSRYRTYRISASITNVNEFILDAKAAVDKAKTILPSRMNRFLGNCIITGESGWRRPMHGSKMRQVNRWILFYGDSSEASTIEAIKAADEYYLSLDESERGKTLLIYMDTAGNQANTQSIADTLKPSIQSMAGYLSKGYSESLAHLDGVEEFPFLIELENSGRMVSGHEGIDKIQAFFKENN